MRIIAFSVFTCFLTLSLVGLIAVVYDALQTGKLVPGFFIPVLVFIGSLLGIFFVDRKVDTQAASAIQPSRDGIGMKTFKAGIFILGLVILLLFATMAIDDEEGAFAVGTALLMFVPLILLFVIIGMAASLFKRK